jgi:homoserine kinase
MKDIATAFAPATVSNVGCGFDVLGFALEGPGDEVTARRIAGGVRIDDIQGDGGLSRAASAAARRARPQRWWRLMRSSADARRWMS